MTRIGRSEYRKDECGHCGDEIGFSDRSEVVCGDCQDLLEMGEKLKKLPFREFWRVVWYGDEVCGIFPNFTAAMHFVRIDAAENTELVENYRVESLSE
jgi:hypothetical protein